MRFCASVTWDDKWARSLQAWSWFPAALLYLGGPPGVLNAQAPPAQPVAAAESLSSALSPQAWNQVEQSIDRALAWLAARQSVDGSFVAPDTAQPAATSLAVMAYLSKGHLTGEGPYGRHIDEGIDFVLRSQQSTGLLAASGSSGRNSGKTANYNHAIAGLMLTEVYGMTDRTRAATLKPAILKALNFTRRVQTEPKTYAADRGGWRYLYGQSYGDSDLSVTSWQLMFLRSARNAEFDVPKQFIDEAIGYVHRCWDDNQGIFYYKISGGEIRWSRGMVGAGILALAMAGQHETRIAQRAGDWLLNYPFRRFGERVGSGDRFFYSTYYCSQAMAQLGGRHWKRFFPALTNVLLQSQRAAGDWPAEPAGSDGSFGNTYTTALAVLSLTPPLQMLPVYQR
ncbi:MAG: prenyltransferase/squalene oxidase repeat-containing protein [Verrucomicrobiales bacterium]